MTFQGIMTLIDSWRTHGFRYAEGVASKLLEGGLVE